MTLTDILLGTLAAAMTVVIWRVVAGPTHGDRAAAMDLGFVVFVAAVALLALRLHTPALLVLVLVATLVGFLATVAVAHLLERRSS